MRLLVLITLSLLLIIISFIYLNHESFVGEKMIEKIMSGVRKDYKALVYTICSFALMCALSVVLTNVYETNTLIDNMKVITLLGLLVTVTVTDFKKHIIPNKVILAGIVFRICYAIAEFITLGTDYFSILKDDICSIILVVVLFLLGVLIVKNGIGMGDIKLILVMGIFQGISGVISSLFFSLLASFVVAIAMLIMKKKTRKDSIAFAPAVLFGTTISMFLTGV